MDRYRDRDEYRGGHEEEGYGRYAAGGRDYSTSGRFFSEDEARGGRYGERTSNSFAERSYNAADFGGGRYQDDFATPGRAINREGSREGYGPSPSDDYERHGYGQAERGAGRGEGSFTARREYGRGGEPDRGRNDAGEFRNASYATFDRSRFNEEDYADPRHDDVSRYGSGDAYLERSVDEHYSNAYRRDQMERSHGRFAVPGPHSGRGPRGYQRSSERIKEEICEHLTHHGYIDATDIEIQIENGEVTLTGTVDSRQTKRLAEEIAESVPGVRDVHNQLRIARTGTDESGDGLHAPPQLGNQANTPNRQAAQGTSRGGSRRGSQS